jgi:hypothetical protein
MNIHWLNGILVLVVGLVSVPWVLNLLKSLFGTGDNKVELHPLHSIALMIIWAVLFTFWQ